MVYFRLKVELPYAQSPHLVCFLNFLIVMNYLLFSLPLHFIRPDKLHVWDESLMPINQTQPPKERIGKTIEFPSPSMEKFLIEFVRFEIFILYYLSDMIFCCKNVVERSLNL